MSVQKSGDVFPGTRFHMKLSTDRERACTQHTINHYKTRQAEAHTRYQLYSAREKHTS